MFFSVCVALCVVLFERGLLFCVLCLIVAPLAPCKNQFAVKLNCNNNNNNNFAVFSNMSLCLSSVQVFFLGPCSQTPESLFLP
jgi:hypothetical protein